MDLERKKYLVILLTIAFVMTVGFAFVTRVINISGDVTYGAYTSFEVFMSDIVVDSSNTVTGTQEIIDDTTINYSATLSNPGDKYSFTFKVKNTGTMDVMLDTVSDSSLTTEQDKYLDYSVTYADDYPLSAKDKIVKKNGYVIIRVVVDFIKDIQEEDLPISAFNLNFSLTLNYIQDDGTGVDVTHTSTSSSLDAFIKKVQSGKEVYRDVGKQFSINLGDTYGTHKLRVANVTNPSICSTEGFSQTACGVVLEFADIITEHVMNPSGTYKGTQYNVGWNVDGWPASSMYTFVNTDIYNALPTSLKNAIIDTTVVSGHGSTSGEINFVTTDKLYLLSAHEVYTDVDGNTSSGIDFYDTSYNNTRQLDYYAGQNVTTSSYSGSIKKKGSSASGWWLRSADFSYLYNFLIVLTNGGWRGDYAFGSCGVSPAFRIA